jgi:NAD(P)-dependent dehydrogenase (short-subunit alcohol dehydrogenase family)
MSDSTSEPPTGKVVFISGESRGFGKATVLKRAGSEGDVAMHDCYCHEEAAASAKRSAIITGPTLFVDGGYAISG